MQHTSPDIRLAQPTSFIGRASELAGLKKLLLDPASRLITLLGPGGAGKTRISIEAAKLYGGEFEDGAVFVPLQPVTSTEFLVPAIAAELGLTLRGPDNPAHQLFSHLADKHTLLVLDNFEHIVEAAELVSDLLAAAPGVKVLASSREALNLSDEWVFPLSGLSFPTDPDAPAEWFDAVRLFAERARRVKRDFVPEQHWETIAHICQLVQGMPLAVELAATWVKALTPAEIVAEIERSLDFLSTSTRNVPERHRSVRAVFEESWRLLEDEERDTLARLSVFRGSFDRKAAEAVSGARLPLLTALIEKSLLRALSDSRYQLHLLLIQYAGEKLAESPEAVTAARDAHSQHYLGILRARANDAQGPRQIEMSKELGIESDNVRAAWQWAAERLDTDALAYTAHVLGQCCQFKSKYVEAAAMMNGAVEKLEKAPPSEGTKLALANVLVQSAWFHIRLGDIAAAEAAITQSGRLFDELKSLPIHQFASDHRAAAGILATIRGEYTEAARLGEDARRIAEMGRDSPSSSLAHYIIARAAFLQGDIEGAHAHISRALAIVEDTGELWFRAYCLVEMGNVARARGDLESARGFYQQSHDLRRDFQDPEGMATALTYLGDVAVQQGAHAEGGSFYDRALALYNAIHDKGGTAAALAGAARAAAAQGDYDHAREHIAEGLTIAAEISHLPQVLTLLGDLALAQLADGDEARALPLLSLVAGHPGSDHEARSNASSAGVKVPRPYDVGAAVEAMKSVLSREDDFGIARLLSGPGAHAPAAVTSFPDSLTAREVEVLRLMAAGKSNHQIAEELFIAPNTVANHVKNILSKTQSANRTEAAAYAVAHSLL